MQTLLLGAAGWMELEKIDKRDLYGTHRSSEQSLTRAYGEGTYLFLSLLEFDKDPTL